MRGKQPTFWEACLWRAMTESERGFVLPTSNPSLVLTESPPPVKYYLDGPLQFVKPSFLVDINAVRRPGQAWAWAYARRE